MADITVAKTAGFCFGVNRAIEIVNRLLDQGKRVYTLGPIIHNPQMVAALEQFRWHEDCLPARPGSARRNFSDPLPWRFS